MQSNYIEELLKKIVIGLLGIYFFISIIQLSQLTNMYPINTILKMQQFLLMSILLFRILFFVKYSLSQWFILALSLGCLFISYLNTNDLSLLMGATIIFGTKGISLKKLIESITKGQSIAVLIVLTLFAIDFLPDFISYRSNGRIRHSFGFRHYLFLGDTFFTILTGYVILYGNKLNRMKYILILSLQLLIYYYTDCRTDTMLVILLLLGNAFITTEHLSKKKKTRILKVGAYLTLFTFSMSSLIVAFVYSPSNVFSTKINSILTGRPNLWNQYTMLYDVRAFGQELYVMSNTMRDQMQIGDSYLVLDNSYLSLLYKFGYAVFFIFILALIFLIVNSYKAKIDYILLLIILMTIYGFTSQAMLFPSKNLIFLCMTIVFERGSKSLIESNKIEYRKLENRSLFSK